jgi:hypothetical protein
MGQVSAAEFCSLGKTSSRLQIRSIVASGTHHAFLTLLCPCCPVSHGNGSHFGPALMKNGKIGINCATAKAAI